MEELQEKKQDVNVASVTGELVADSHNLTAEDAEEAVDQDVSLSLTEHLEELRRRIFWCVATWFVISCFAYCYVDKFLAKVRELAGEGFTFVYTSPTEAFMAFIKLAMAAGLVMSLPVILYHMAAFVNPALKRKERRLLMILAPLCLILFILGATFAWFVALPIMWRFFLSFQADGITALWTIGEVVGFAAGLILICGCVFELPIVVIGAAKAGLISYEKLSGTRRVSYFIILVLTAVITPTPDAFTCAVVSGPIIALFELSLLFLRFMK